MAKKKAKYGKKAQEEVGKALHNFKEGKQRSGKKSTAKSRKQAIAIGLSKARKQGGKVQRKSDSLVLRLRWLRLGTRWRSASWHPT